MKSNKTTTHSATQPQAILNEALEISNLYTKLVNPRSNTNLPLGSIIAALYYPEFIEQEQSCPKEQLIESILEYSACVADIDVKYRYRNYNYFGKGYYWKFIKNSHKPLADQGTKNDKETKK